jgi:3'(2'), 5'-bisphosphate nucleotidase
VNSYTLELPVAIEAVQRAARLCVAVRATLVTGVPQEKADHSPVTIADYGAQALACELLRSHFPDDAIVGEEDAAVLRQPEQAAYLAQVTAYVQQQLPAATPQQVCDWIDWGHGSVAARYWTLDPIDGTKGFVRRDQYAVALALVENGVVQLGVLACPALPLVLDTPDGPVGALFVAVRGAGTQVAALGGGELVPVSTHPAIRRFAESVEASHSDQGRQEALARALGIEAPPIRMDSQVKYGLLARGDAALYLRLPSPKAPDYREKIWDHAAGSIIVEEAGGRVSDMYGQPLDWAGGAIMQHNRGVVATRGVDHDRVIALLTKEAQ